MGSVTFRRTRWRGFTYHKTGVRFPDGPGRFGGGWDWKLGVQATKRFETIILSLVFVEIIVVRR